MGSSPNIFGHVPSQEVAARLSSSSERVLDASMMSLEQAPQRGVPQFWTASNRWKSVEPGYCFLMCLFSVG